MLITLLSSWCIVFRTFWRCHRRDSQEREEKDIHQILSSSLRSAPSSLKKKTWKTCQILRWSVLRDVGCQRNILLRRRHQRRVGFLHNTNSEFGTATGLGCDLFLSLWDLSTRPFNIQYSIFSTFENTNFMQTLPFRIHRSSQIWKLDRTTNSEPSGWCRLNVKFSVPFTKDHRSAYACYHCLLLRRLPHGLILSPRSCSPLPVAVQDDCTTPFTNHNVLHDGTLPET